MYTVIEKKVKIVNLSQLGITQDKFRQQSDLELCITFNNEQFQLTSTELSL